MTNVKLKYDVLMGQYDNNGDLRHLLILNLNIGDRCKDSRRKLNDVQKDSETMKKK
jgi:hypothetical protein